MQIVENKVLVVSTKQPHLITEAISKSKVINRDKDDYEVAVHWGLAEAQALTALKFPAPSPMGRDYQWTGKLKPFSHQKETANFLTLNQKALCLSQAGTGKTASVIWAADYLMKLGKVKRVLVVCPLSIMKSAWQEDLFKFAMHRSCAVAHGSAAARAKVIKSGAEFVIINYDGLEVVKQELIDGGFDLVVADESTALKNPMTRRWKMFRSVSANSPWLWLLTGTPAAQSPVDAFGLAKLVNPSMASMYFGQFRDKVMYKLSQFTWAPRPDSKEIVHQALQPAIRFEKKDCLDLPEVMHVDRNVPLTAQQKKYYEALRTSMRVSAAGETITAVNAAVKLNKLLQISCIAAGTPVLTRRGWVCIEQVNATDEVWDGVDWTPCGGAKLMGVKPTVTLHGVRLTPDHRVLTTAGWVTAEEYLDGYASNRFERENVRLPDSFAARGEFNREIKKSNVAMPVRLRGHSNKGVPEPTFKTPEQRSTLRMQARRAHHYARDVLYKALQHMDPYAPPLRRQNTQRLPELWGPWHHGLRSVVGELRRFLGGHVHQLRSASFVRSDRQRRPIRAEQLSVGDSYGTGVQHPKNSSHTNYVGGTGCVRSSETLRAKNSNAACAPIPVQMGRRESANNPGGEVVYDILNCGPRKRFVVQGSGGECTIVHNCGSVYDDDKGVIEFDVSNRINVVLEVIEEASNKVLIFVPFTHTIELLQKTLDKHKITNAVLSGSVSLNKRSEAVKAFQETPDPRVLIIQPQAAAHGLTLTAADTIIWYAPVTSVETYLQANARNDRPGQRNPMTVVHITGSEVETKIYSMLRSKVSNHTKLVDLYRSEIDS